jgi:hypothetical protein
LAKAALASQISVAAAAFPMQASDQVFLPAAWVMQVLVWLVLPVWVRWEAWVEELAARA